MKKYLWVLLCCAGLLNMPAQCWQSIDAGAEVSAGIKTDGTLWTWGSNANGQLGDGTTIDKAVPTQVGIATNWQSISVNLAHAAAIQANGTLWVWGSNIYGQLGNGTTVPSLVPIQVPSTIAWKSVAAGADHVVAIKADGTLWAWGRNTWGNIGDGTYIDRSIPVQIGTDTDWQSVAGGSQGTAAIKTNGTLWAWGSNTLAQLGNGTMFNSGTPVPQQVGTDTDWQMILYKWVSCLALKTNGTLWGWGAAGSGQLGNGSNVMAVTTPVQIGMATDWQSVTLHIVYGAGIKTNGTLWSWGINTNGGLGNGTTVSTNAPAQVGNISTWKMVAAGDLHSLGIRTDGSLWAWGNNNKGQLGDGSLADSYVPIEISALNVGAISGSSVACAGNPVILTGTGALTYTWSGGVSNGVPFIPSASGNYTVTGTDVFGCFNSATISVVVVPQTTITANATSTLVCAGSTVALTGSGGSAYAWSNGVADGLAFTPASTTTYTVADPSGCSTPASITVNVLPLPLVSVNSPSVCSGSNVLLTASSGSSSSHSYSWSTGATGSSITVSPVSTSSYTVSATTANGCTGMAVSTVSVIPVNTPVTGFSYASPVCMIGSNPLPATVPGFSPGGVYSSGTGVAIDPATGLIDLSQSNPGAYVVTYSVAANGCNPSNSSMFTVTLINPAAAVTSFSYASPVCSRDADPSPLLSPGFTSGGIFSGTGLALSAGSGMIDLAHTPAGIYTVAYHVPAANCVQAGSGTATITIQPNPSLSVSSATAIIIGEQTALTAISSANTYTWYPASGLSCSDCATPQASPKESTTYCVRTTDGVCSSSTCVTVSVKTLCEDDEGMFLPNAFSPNGDGTNDVFCVQGRNRCLSEFQMSIYDRWGEKVFECTDLFACWDGTHKGRLMIPDVYVYYIRARDLDRKELVKKGNVTLLK